MQRSRPRGIDWFGGTQLGSPHPGEFLRAVNGGIAFEVPSHVKFPNAPWAYTQSDVIPLRAPAPSGWWHPRYKKNLGRALCAVNSPRVFQWSSILLALFEHKIHTGHMQIFGKKCVGKFLTFLKSGLLGGG